MKKILTLLNANHLSQGAIDLGCYLAKLAHSKLTGIFPDYPNDDHSAYTRFIDSTAPYVVLSQQKARTMEETIDHFRQACLLQDVDCDIHRDSENPKADVVAESLFADILIVDEAVSFSVDDDRVPSEFITTLLIDAKCPVIIAPSVFEAIEEIIFAYDGSYSSLFAMKQLTYLFPELKDKKILVIQVTDTGVMNESDKLHEWLSNYYSEIVYETLGGNASNRLLEIAMSKQKALLVIGAFGRNMLSSFFRSSAADNIIKLSNNPVFIAHH